MPPKKEQADRRIDDVLECASKTLTVLREKTVISANLGHEIESRVKNSFPLPKTHLLADQAPNFDSLGTDLWNHSAQLIHDDEFPYDQRAHSPARIHIGVLVRVFALLLLDIAQRSSARRSNGRGQQARLLKVALKTSRLCLDKDALDLSIKALEICSQNVTATSDPPPFLRISETPSASDTHSETDVKILAAEYYLLRLMHAWKSSRLDLADHFFAKFDALGIVNATDLSVKEADLCDEIAKSLLKTKQLQDAKKWFDRAFHALLTCDDETTTQEAAELKLFVGVSLVEQLLADGQSSCRSRAWNVVHHLEKTHGLQNRFAVEIIKLQVMAAGDSADGDQLQQTLLRMTNMLVLTEDGFKNTMRAMRQAMHIAAAPTLVALKTFICSRLSPELRADTTEDVAMRTSMQTWLEKATITYIMFATSPPQGSAGNANVAAIKELLDEISNMNQVQFSAKATHAAQTLLWKAASTWASCQLLQHPIFVNAGCLNKARVGRKLMIHALDRGDIPIARETFFQMPKDAREESLTQFLAFRLALQSHDEELAEGCLRNLARHALKDPTHLYACVIESQRSPMRHVAVMALQAVLSQRPAGIHLACLLRCTVRLLIAELDAAADNEALNKLALEVLLVFEVAAQSGDAFRQTSNDSWRTEVQWWSKNAYNVSIRLCGDIEPELTVRFLATCTEFMDNYPSDGGTMQEYDIETRKMMCAFLSTTALIVLGRSEDREPEYTLQCFLNAQLQIKSFNSQYTKLRNKLKGEASIVASQRAFAMLKFELECILKLGQLDKMPAVLRHCLDAGVQGDASGRWDTLADLLIIVHKRLDSSAAASESATLITTLLQNAINDTWKCDKDITKVARWLRYTFLLCINHTQSYFSLKLIQQAASMAENGHRGRHDPYPEAELQWLATTGFNYAIDLLAEEEEECGMKWMESALEVARWSQDNGALHAILVGKRKVLEERRGGR